MSDIVTELEDRWIVNARHHIVIDFAASPSALRIQLDSGLRIEVSGPWRATLGSPITGQELDPDALDDQVGSDVRSLVLFSTGSFRIVLSPGVSIVARADESTRVTATLPGRFTWAAEGHSVTRWLAEASNDG